MAILVGDKALKFRFFGAREVKFVNYGDLEIWASIVWHMDMIITDAQTANVYNFEHTFPDETDGVTILKGISSVDGHEEFLAKFEFINISKATAANMLVTDTPIQDGDKLIIVLDDDSIHEYIASGVQISSDYTMSTTSITNGQIPSRVFAVDAKLSFAIDGSFVDAETFTDGDYIVTSGAAAGTLDHTSSTPLNWDVPLGVSNINLCAIAGGGGGGSRRRDDEHVGGGYAGEIFDGVLDVGGHSSLLLTNGSGGDGGNTDTSGSAGGNTTIGSVLTLVGGAGGDRTNENYGGDGASRSTCAGSFNDGSKQVGLAWNGTAWGGEAGLGNGGDGDLESYGDRGYSGGGGGGASAPATHSSVIKGGDGGDGVVYISWDQGKSILFLTRTYNKLLSTSGSLTITPKVLLKSIGDIVSEIKGSIVI